MLEPLAYQMMCRKTREITAADARKIIRYPLQRVTTRTTPEDFLKMIENSSGLLLEREDGVYGFAHQTFQEYLAAVHVHEQKLESELTPHVRESWWHETIRLYCARASDATPVIEACLAGDGTEFATLALAVECLEEAGSVQPDLRARVETLVSEQVEADDPELRRLAAGTLLTLRLRRMVRVDDDRYIDNTLISHAEYQLFLDEQRAQGEVSPAGPLDWRPVPRGAGSSAGRRHKTLRYSRVLRVADTAGAWPLALPTSDPGGAWNGRLDESSNGGGIQQRGVLGDFRSGDFRLVGHMRSQYRYSRT